MLRAIDLARRAHESVGDALISLPLNSLFLFYE
jgi:hypothetical protein